MPTIYNPPVPTYTALAEIELATNTADIVLTGFSQDYEDLILVISGKTTASSGCNLQFNGDTGTNYSWTIIDVEQASTIGSGNNPSYNSALGGISSPQGFQTVIQLFGYSSDKYKNIISHSGSPTDVNYVFWQRIAASIWKNTNPITTIKTVAGTTYQAGTIIRLFGVEA